MAALEHFVPSVPGFLTRFNTVQNMVTQFTGFFELNVWNLDGTGCKIEAQRRQPLAALWHGLRETNALYFAVQESSDAIAKKTASQCYAVASKQDPVAFVQAPDNAGIQRNPKQEQQGQKTG